MSREEWVAQVRRGVLELAILALIGNRPRYGYEIVTALADSDSLAAAEGTVYPLLRRLREQGYLATERVDSVDGPPRIYYSLTTSGRARSRALASEWRQLAGAMDHLLRESGK